MKPEGSLLRSKNPQVRGDEMLAAVKWQTGSVWGCKSKVVPVLK